jgi:Na+-transporting NADH:ubiquinone oxidoreductase subunit B
MAQESEKGPSLGKKAPAGAKPFKRFNIQSMMVKVLYGLAPCMVGAVYFFGWRALVLACVVFVAGIAAEAAFTWRAKKPVTSAVFVTCLIYTLSLPPTVPFWIAVVGIVFGVIFGKMAFGGTGHNIYNPAMAGRCFIYVAFPVAMTNTWAAPFEGAAAGFGAWAPGVDAITSATPLAALYQGQGSVDWLNLLLGNTSGSLGETGILLIVAGGIFVLWTKAANWRLFAAYMLGGFLATLALILMGVPNPGGLFTFFLAGSFLFGAFFIVTEPISGPKTNQGRWIYGFVVGALVIVLRRYSNFSEGVMFAILLGNTFVPILDIAVKSRMQKAKARA